MRHSVILMFGGESNDCLLSLYQKILRSGNSRTEDFLRAFSLDWKSNEVIVKTITKIQDEESVENAEKLSLSDYSIWAQENRESVIHNFLRDIHRQQVNIRERGDYSNLHLNLIVPLYEDITGVVEFLNAIKSMSIDIVDVDLVGIVGDLKKSFIGTTKSNDEHSLSLQSTIDSLQSLVAYRKKNYGVIDHLLAIQDYQNGGLSLALTHDSLMRILAEYSLLVIENYGNLFGNVHSETDLQTFGLSMINLDDAYFQEYLYRKALSQIILQDNVEQNSVDINKASKIANDIIEPWKNILSKIYRLEVQQKMDLGKNETEIIADVDITIKKEFESLKEKLEEYIHDKKLSLPDKRCILAAILGEDDALFMNDLFNDQLLNFHDMEKEAMGQFLDANNYVLAHEEHIEEAILSEGEEEAVYPIDEMRQNRITMRRSISFIRNMEQEQQSLEKQLETQENAQKCFIKNGFFQYGEHEYKLLPQVDEIPLKETYKSHPVTRKSIDLSSGMPNIKDQGQQGSCLAFAITSVFETLYQRKTRETIDLSEQFLYYIARDKAGTTQEDNGSCMLYALEALSEIGLCEEQYWAYMTAETAYNIRPSEKAYEDALNRKVAKALQVELTEDAIRSALSDGYPVVFSTNLYNSFANAPGGFISIPTQEERDSANSEDIQHHRHAMVICGYNDETRVFKVRNSWGKHFGVDGYCYMPYSYITNTELTNGAAIVTDIALTEIIKTHDTIPTEYPQLNFNRIDSTTQYGINQVLLSEEYANLSQLQMVDENLVKRCLTLKQTLKNPNYRKALCQSATTCYNEDLDKKSKEIERVIEEQVDAKAAFEKETIKKCIKFSLVCLCLITFFLTTSILDKKCQQQQQTYTELLKAGPTRVDDKGIKHYQVSKSKERTDGWIKVELARYKVLIPILSFCHRWWIVCTCFGLFGVVLLLSLIKNHKARIELQQEYEDVLDSLSKEKNILQKNLSEINIKFHLAGSMLTTFFSLSEHLETKYAALISLVENLKKLKYENEERLKGMTIDKQHPFFSILSTDLLSTYFDEHAKQIIGEVSIDQCIAGYDVTSETFDKFLNNLKAQISNRVAGELSKFSVYQYMSGKANYPYALKGNKRALDYLEALDQNSEVFMLCNGIDALNPSKILFAHVERDEDANWQNTYRPAFSIPPIAVQIESSTKMVLIRLLDLNLKQIEWIN